ncbi:exoribonuclease R [Escherichia coli]|nr:exoribonuclease R [Escherichia coli]
MVPDDSRLSFDILIPPDQIMGARMGFVVVVELTQRPTRRTKAVGKIVEVLGDNMGTGMAVDIALRTHEIPYIWPQAVEQQVAGLKEEVPEEAKAAVLICAIYRWSPLMAKTPRDFDDAVLLREKTRRRLAFMGRDCRRQLLCASVNAAGQRKRVTVARRCTSLRRLSRCCRKCSLTACVRSTRR